MFLYHIALKTVKNIIKKKFIHFKCTCVNYICIDIYNVVCILWPNVKNDKFGSVKVTGDLSCNTNIELKSSEENGLTRPTGPVPGPLGRQKMLRKMHRNDTRRQPSQENGDRIAPFRRNSGSACARSSASGNVWVEIRRRSQSRSRTPPSSSTHRYNYRRANHNSCIYLTLAQPSTGKLDETDCQFSTRRPGILIVARQSYKSPHTFHLYVTSSLVAVKYSDTALHNAVVLHFREFCAQNRSGGPGRHAPRAQTP